MADATAHHRHCWHVSCQIQKMQSLPGKLLKKGGKQNHVEISTMKVHVICDIISLPA